MKWKAKNKYLPFTNGSNLNWITDSHDAATELFKQSVQLVHILVT